MTFSLVAHAPAHAPAWRRFLPPLARRRLERVLVAVLATGLPATALSAQPTPPPAGPPRFSADNAVYLGSRLAVGALRAGWAAHRGGRSVTRAVAFGAIGGLASYEGALAIGAGGGRRLPGLVLTMLGGNLVRSGATGAPLASDLLLAFPPLAARVRLRGPGERVQFVLLPGSTLTAAGLWIASYGRASIDWPETIEGGGLAFRAHQGALGAGGLPAAPECGHTVWCSGERAGLHYMGITSFGVTEPAEAARVHAHETLHRAQYLWDLTTTAPDISAAAWRHALGTARGTRWAARVVLDLPGPARAVSELAGFLGSGHLFTTDNLAEREAYWLTGDRACGGSLRPSCRW